MSDLKSAFEIEGFSDGECEIESCFDRQLKGFYISFDLLKSVVSFSVLDTKNEMDLLLKEAKVFPEGGADGFCSSNKNGSQIYIILNKEEFSDMILVHEIAHAMLHAARFANLDLNDFDSDEVFCEEMGLIYSGFQREFKERGEK